MTLFVDALTLIHAQLTAIANGQKVKAINIGQFTPKQHSEINVLRASKNLPPLESPEIVFVGSHMFKSRITIDNYTINDVVLQINAAVSINSEVIHTRNMTGLQSTVKRADGYGNFVLDEAVFELTQKKPKAELYSVIPRGDKLKVKQQKK